MIGQQGLSRFQWKKDNEGLQRWKDGFTGVPLVDAAMRELKETGYISNRSRFISANYFATELRIDWRLGAAHFENHLIDYDVASNWVNWLQAANLMNERNLILHPVRQAMALDPNGTYVKRWVPEIVHLPIEWIHRPWKAPPEVLDRCGIVLGRQYPAPIGNKLLN